jgi:hypothetical protein
MSTTCEFINVAQHLANTSESFQLASKENKLNFLIIFFYSPVRVFVSVRVHLKNKRKHQTCRFQGKEENRRRT